MSIRVLVCDDQPLVRLGFVATLDAQPDMRVIGEAGDGRQAVDLAARQRPDVVVLDIRMPVLDGLEATRLLAGPAAADPVKVLVVTTFHLDEYVYRALRYGASGFLLKDAQPGELVHAVRVVAAGEAMLSPAVTRRLIGTFASRPVPGPAPALAALTDREREVLILVARGLSNPEIAERLTVARETVKTHVSRILTKLELRDRMQAALFAHRHGLVDEPS